MLKSGPSDRKKTVDSETVDTFEVPNDNFHTPAAPKRNTLVSDDFEVVPVGEAEKPRPIPKLRQLKHQYLNIAYSNYFYKKNVTRLVIDFKTASAKTTEPLPTDFCIYIDPAKKAIVTNCTSLSRTSETPFINQLLNTLKELKVDGANPANYYQDFHIISPVIDEKHIVTFYRRPDKPVAQSYVINSHAKDFNLLELEAGRKPQLLKLGTQATLDDLTCGYHTIFNTLHIYENLELPVTEEYFYKLATGPVSPVPHSIRLLDRPEFRTPSWSERMRVALGNAFPTAKKYSGSTWREAIERDDNKAIAKFIFDWPDQSIWWHYVLYFITFTWFFSPLHSLARLIGEGFTYSIKEGFATLADQLCETSGHRGYASLAIGVCRFFQYLFELVHFCVRATLCPIENTKDCYEKILQTTGNSYLAYLGGFVAFLISIVLTTLVIHFAAPSILKGIADISSGFKDIVTWLNARSAEISVLFDFLEDAAIALARTLLIGIRFGVPILIAKISRCLCPPTANDDGIPAMKDEAEDAVERIHDITSRSTIVSASSKDGVAAADADAPSTSTPEAFPRHLSTGFSPAAAITANSATIVAPAAMVTNDTSLIPGVPITAPGFAAQS